MNYSISATEILSYNIQKFVTEDQCDIDDEETFQELIKKEIWLIAIPFGKYYFNDSYLFSKKD